MFEQDLKKSIKDIKKEVDPVIEILLSNKIALKFQKIINYQMQSGGKRLRPALAVLSCRMLKGKMDDVIYPAAGLEILHNYTLIIDDIIDNGNLRRGKKTTRAKYGQSIANLISQAYAVSIFEAVSHSKDPLKILDVFSETLKKITEGQFLDILLERKGREKEEYVQKNRIQHITKTKYLEMISKKTAFLFQACCEVGGICAFAERKDIKSLKEFGFNLGIAFQIQDDILDMFGEEKDFGKKIGKDIEERKGGNIIILFALKEMHQEDKKTVLNVMAKTRINKRDVEKIMKLISQTKAKEKALKLRQEYYNKAKKYLNVLPRNQYNRTLENLAEFVVERKK